MQDGLFEINWEHPDDTLLKMCDEIEHEAEDILAHILVRECAMDKFEEIVNKFRDYKTKFEAICEDKSIEISQFDFITI